MSQQAPVSLHKISGMVSDIPLSYLRIPDPELNF